MEFASIGFEKKVEQEYESWWSSKRFPILLHASTLVLELFWHLTQLISLLVLSMTWFGGLSILWAHFFDFPIESAQLFQTIVT